MPASRSIGRDREPRTILPDDSNRDPIAPGEPWPEAGHRLCASRVLMSIDELVLDVVRRRIEGMSRARPGRTEEEALKGRTRCPGSIEATSPRIPEAAHAIHLIGIETIGYAIQDRGATRLVAMGRTTPTWQHVSRRVLGRFRPARREHAAESMKSAPR